MRHIFEKIIVWSKYQFDQIRKGGPVVALRKVMRLIFLIRMNMFASLAVRLELDWPKAYMFVGRKGMRTLKKMKSDPNTDTLAIKDMEDQIIQYFTKGIAREPSLADQLDWLKANQTLRSLFYMQGRLDDMHEVCEKDAGLRYKIAEKHQFDDLGVEFLPRSLAKGSIGVYEFLDVYIKAGMLGLRPIKKIILLVDQETLVNNLSYLNCWRRHITIITDPTLIELLTPLEERLQIPLNHYMNLRGKVHKSFLALGSVCDRWVVEQRDPVIKISDEHIHRGRKTLETLGMDANDWFVCLHVRESGSKDNNSQSNDFRDADIDTYHRAIKSVRDAGGWVIRMGDSTMKPLPKMPNVIDYAHSDAKSDWMDVFLCAQCRFFIATSSGLHLFALTFGKPVVMTNSLPTCGMYFLTSKDLFIPKHLKVGREGRDMNFSEIFTPPLAMMDSQSSYDKENIEIRNNTEDEINNLVEEMMERWNESAHYSEEDENLQKRFKAVASICGKRYGKEHMDIYARIGRSWLRQYETLLPQDKQDNLKQRPEKSEIGVK